MSASPLPFPVFWPELAAALAGPQAWVGIRVLVGPGRATRRPLLGPSAGEPCQRRPTTKGPSFFLNGPATTRPRPDSWLSARRPLGALLPPGGRCGVADQPLAEPRPGSCLGCKAASWGWRQERRGDESLPGATARAACRARILITPGASLQPKRRKIASTALTQPRQPEPSESSLVSSPSHFVFAGAGPHQAEQFSANGAASAPGNAHRHQDQSGKTHGPCSWPAPGTPASIEPQGGTGLATAAVTMPRGGPAGHKNLLWAG